MLLFIRNDSIYISKYIQRKRKRGYNYFLNTTLTHNHKEYNYIKNITIYFITMFIQLFELYLATNHKLKPEPRKPLKELNM